MRSTHGPDPRPSLPAAGRRPTWTPHETKGGRNATTQRANGAEKAVRLTQRVPHCAVLPPSHSLSSPSSIPPFPTLRSFAPPRFRVPSPLPLVLALLLLAAIPTQAKLAVFVDGRVLHVADAHAEDGHIVLTLPGGGSLTVPATRIDRVIEDEVPQEEDTPLPPGEGCPWAWQEQELPSSTPFRDEIASAARKAGLNPMLLAALVHAESNFDPRARSRAGAKGLTQLMPAAAQDHKVLDVWNPGENLRGGAEHLRAYLDRFSSLRLALAAYNAGAATVERAGGVPPYRETREFIRRILAEACPSERAISPSRGAKLEDRGGSSS